MPSASRGTDFLRVCRPVDRCTHEHVRLAEACDGATPTGILLSPMNGKLALLATLLPVAGFGLSASFC